MTMTVQCPTCSTSFPVDPAKVPERGVNARCSVCSDVFRVEKPAGAARGSTMFDQAEAGGATATESAVAVEEAPADTVEESWATDAGPATQESVADPVEDESQDESQDDWGAPAEAPAAVEEVDETVEEAEPVEEHWDAPAEAPAAVEEVDETVEEAEPVEEHWDAPAEAPAAVEEVTEAPGAESEHEPAAVEAQSDVGAESWSDTESTDEAWSPEPTDEALGGTEVLEEEAPSDAEAPAAPVAGFQFGKRDPHDKARRLARVLVSDMIMYNPDRHGRALESGTLQADFQDEIVKSWKEYVDQVGEELARGTNYFADALNEILAKGEQVFPDGPPV